MAFNALAITNSRARGIKYAGPAKRAYLSIIYNRLPSTMPPTSYLLPFTIDVWMLLLLSLILFYAAFLIISVASPGNRDSTPSHKIHTSVFRTGTLTFIDEALDYPAGGPSKVVYGVLLITTVAVFAHYTSIFTSFLATQEENIPFRNLEDVIANKDYFVLVVRNTRHHDMFQYAKEGVYPKVWRRILKQGDSSFEFSIKQGLFKMYTGKYSYLTDGPTCLFLTDGNCSVAFAPIKYGVEHWNLASRRDFPYTRYFTLMIMRLMERGIHNRLQIVYKLENRQPCTFSPSSSMGIDQCIGLFFILLCGIVFASIVLCVEIFFLKDKYPSAIKNSVIIINTKP